MKKAAKIVLLVVLLAMVGVIVYAVMVWPVNPTRMKPAESYEQLRDTVEKKTDIRVPGEDLLPWTVTERQLRMDVLWNSSGATPSFSTVSQRASGAFFRDGWSKSGW